MKRMADHYFNKYAPAIAVPESTPQDNQPPPLERRRPSEGKENEKEHPFAAYSGLEKRKNLDGEKVSTIFEGKETEKEHLTAIYWG